MKRLGFSLSFIIQGSAYVLFCLLLVSGYQAVASNEKLQQTTGKDWKISMMISFSSTMRKTGGAWTAMTQAIEICYTRPADN